MDRAEDTRPCPSSSDFRVNFCPSRFSFESASLIKLFWKALLRDEYRSHRETSGAHLGRKAKGMVTTSALGVISSQAPKGESPWGRFRDRTVGRWSLQSTAYGTILPPRKRSASEAKEAAWSGKPSLCCS